MNKEYLAGFVIIFIIVSFILSAIVFIGSLNLKPEYEKVGTPCILLLQFALGGMGLYTIKGAFRYIRRAQVKQADFIHTDFQVKAIGEQHAESALIRAKLNARSDPEEIIICPGCGHKTPKKTRCVYCGSEIKDIPADSQVSYSADNVPEPQPLSEDAVSETVTLPEDTATETVTLQKEEDQRGFQKPAGLAVRLCTVFKKIFHSDSPEQNKIWKLAACSAIAGAICGYMWGGFYDPWRNRGLAPGILNFFLFGGWGFAQASGMLAARNLGLVKKRSMLILTGAVCGGLWIFVFSTTDFLTALPEWEPVFFRSALGLAAGFISGAGISAICILKLSKTMTLGNIPKKQVEKP
ncbi:MAG: hypothetical protein GY749_32720 [Desulfobacteraceae bacterium]|nr:hypothetical protein [Desulfobacteraceae bacterium]